MGLEQKSMRMDVELALDAVYHALETDLGHPDVGFSLQQARAYLEDALWWLKV